MLSEVYNANKNGNYYTSLLNFGSIKAMLDVASWGHIMQIYYKIVFFHVIAWCAIILHVKAS